VDNFTKLQEMTSKERQCRRFSESFRQEQVDLIESGNLSVEEVSRLYEVKRQNVKRWLKKYGTKEISPQIIITTSSDYDRIGQMTKEIKELKELIGSQQIQIVHLESVRQEAEKKLGKGFEKK